MVVFSRVLSGFSATMDESVAKRMAGRPEVAFVEQDGRKTASVEQDAHRTAPTSRARLAGPSSASPRP